MFWLAELGTRLKEARLSKGYSLDDLQEITKIQKRYLVAIEDGNFSIMPGTFYVRAFIKQYAEAVGLNPDQLFEEFKHEIPSHQQEEVAQSFTNSPTRKKFSKTSTNKMMETLPKYILAIFIVVIIAVTWFLWSQKASKTPDQEEVQEQNNAFQYEQTAVEKPPVQEKDDEKTAGDDESEKTDDEAKDEEKEEEPKQTISEGQVQPDGVTTEYELSGTDTLKIRVEVSGDTWVSIRDANGTEQVEARIYKQGEVVEFDATANSYARIRLGFSENGKIFINDEELKFVQNKSTQNFIVKFSEKAEEE